MPACRKPCPTCPWRVGQHADEIPGFKLELAEDLIATTRDKTIKVPGVMNPILEGMLERRGFVLEWESFEDRDIDVWTRWAS